MVPPLGCWQHLILLVPEPGFSEYSSTGGCVVAHLWLYEVEPVIEVDAASAR